MKKAHKAFTLIELLAVIVILAIIALIATPIVLNVIKDSKIESNKRSIENIIRAADLYAMELDIKSQKVDENENIYQKLDLESRQNWDIYVYINNQKEVAMVADINNIHYEKDFDSDLKTYNNFINESTLLTVQEGLILPEGVTKTQIELIEFRRITTNTLKSLSEKITPEEKNIYDVSSKNDKSIITYLEDRDNNGLYEMHIVSNKIIMAPRTSRPMFSNYTELYSLKLNNLDTRNIKSMEQMFRATGYNSETFTLDLGDKFYTSGVDGSFTYDMYYMFFETGFNSKVFTLDLGDKFDTSKVKNMTNMFYNMGSKSSVFTLNLGAKFTKIASNSAIGSAGKSGAIIKVPEELYIDEHNIRLNKDTDEKITVNDRIFQKI